MGDGNLDYLRRIDHQVKLRGYRIELGEIEAALDRHREIKQSVVVVREGERGENRLVAYAVAENRERKLKANDLRQWLREKIPEYMAPSVYILLDELPLTANGKIDRKALPEPGTERPELERLFTSPRTLLERTLAEIWAEVLRVEGIGIHDDFFDLGGHSLLATQVISRIRSVFGLNLPLRALFEQPTVAGLAEQIVLARDNEVSLIAPPIPPADRAQPLPLSFAQQRLWFIDQLQPGNAAYNMPAAINLIGGLDVDALHKTFNEIIRRHEALRTHFPNINGKPAQRIVPAQPLRLEVIDLTAADVIERDASAQILAREEAEQPFDLSHGPLLRVKLVRLAPDRHLLLITIHHIISDGWSLGVLVREIGILYEAFLKGDSSPLSDLPIQYADFAVWQRQQLEGEIMFNQLKYWKRHLDEAPPLLLLTDKARPSVSSFRGGALSIVFDQEMVRSLKIFSRAEDSTLYMTMLAAYLTLLTRYTGQEDIAIGTPIANRHRTEIEGLIGFFVNTLVIRSDLSGNPTFRETVARVRETTLKAYTMQDLPFERLVEELQPERDMSRNPIVQVMFAFQNAPLPPLQLANLILMVAPPEISHTRFDIEVHFWEEGETLRTEIIYSTDLFHAETIARMFAHYQELLASIIADPDQRLLDLSMLTEQERRRLTEDWCSA
jgi:NRPS condensation-like uncharacterized protein/acyl carrier protein